MIASAVVKSDQGNLNRLTNRSISNLEPSEKYCLDTRGACRVVTLTRYHYDFWNSYRCDVTDSGCRTRDFWDTRRCVVRNFFGGNLKSWQLHTVWSSRSWTVGIVGCATNLYNSSYSISSSYFYAEPSEDQNTSFSSFSSSSNSQERFLFFFSISSNFLDLVESLFYFRTFRFSFSVFRLGWVI